MSYKTNGAKTDFNFACGEAPADGKMHPNNVSANPSSPEIEEISKTPPTRTKRRKCQIRCPVEEIGLSPFLFNEDNLANCRSLLIRYSFEAKMALVYDVEPKNTLNDILASDDACLFGAFDVVDFGWKGQMKMAKNFAKLLSWYHENLIAFGSIDAKDIFEPFLGFIESGSRLSTEEQLMRIGYYAPEVFEGISSE
ncbi:hypothetical protein ACH5RR_032692 [Cinchona calisaya]|uniref:Uncharacterized protein n=1 Tax=Cinchona calisaya TaxID=153742 RepID=A0ABD2YN01_9GENT